MRVLCYHSRKLEEEIFDLLPRRDGLQIDKVESFIDLESKLPDYDILLIHPGVKNQNM